MRLTSRISRVFVYIWMYEVVSSSTIVFHADPATFHPALTPNLTLTCTLEDTPTSNGALIGRDVSSTNENLSAVTSLVVSDSDGHVMAAITPGSPAHLMDPGLTNLQVAGHMTGDPGERGRLQLTFDPPTHAQAHAYVCEVNAINGQGHNVKFSADLEVTAPTPTISDLVNYIVALQVKDRNHEAKDLAKDKLIHDLQVSDQTKTNQIQALESQVKNAQSKLTAMTNIESGTLQCGDSHTWTQQTHTGLNYTTVAHTFTSKFDKPPKMQWGVTGMYFHDTNDDKPYVIYYTDVISITPTGFTLKCSIERYEHYWLRRMSVSWAAFPDVS